MKRDDWMLFVLTFLTGAALGMYVYFAVWKPVYAPEDLGSEEVSASEWSLVGERRYGDSIDASFRLLADGSYVFITLDEAGEPLDRKKGSVSNSLIRELSVSVTELSSYEESKQCDISSRAEYHYRYTVDQDTYILDTCDSALGHNSDLAKSLNKVWQKIGGSDEASLTPAKIIEDWINDNLGVNKNEE